MKQILIVDDDAYILDACKMIFERAGYRVAAMSSGDSLLNGGFDEPDIFLLDRQLRGADGLVICRHLKNRQPAMDTPVIVFSATPNVEPLSRQAGADEFVQKPFKTKDLLKVVKKQLGDDIT